MHPHTYFNHLKINFKMSTINPLIKLASKNLSMSSEEIQKAKNEWYQINAPVGIAFGYPQCCINQFCDEPKEVLQKRIPSKDDMNRYEAGKIDGIFTGFIPCSDHANKILSKQITLMELIGNRREDIRPFPNGYLVTRKH